MKRKKAESDVPKPRVVETPSRRKPPSNGIPVPLVLVGCTVVIVSAIVATRGPQSTGVVASNPPGGASANSAPAAVSGAVPEAFVVPNQRTPPTATLSTASASALSATTNAFGATVVVKSGDRELLREVLSGDDLKAEFDQKVFGELTFEAHLGGEVARATGVSAADAAGGVDLAFSTNQLKAIQKAATCLIRMPDGGFGSGFLMNDRQTITTAAHCVAADKVGDLEFAFRPMQSDEVTRTGARLIFFDAGLDVAVLQLPEPLGDEWPYMVHASAPPNANTEVHAIGNPSRGGKPDPLFLRSGKIQGVGTDEFFLDVELKPGNSGGPVCAADSMVAHGIVSWKFLRKVTAELSYEEMGRSFAKITDLAGDAYENFMSNDDEAKARHIDRLEGEFSEQRAKILAQQAALAMGVDSVMYWVICRDVSVNYIREINAVRARAYSSLGQARRAERIAHEEFMENDGPKYAEKARTEVTPRLRMADSKHYDAALKSEYLSDELKDQLRACYEDYKMIRAAAENVVQKKKSAKQLREERLNGTRSETVGDGKSRNVLEFFDWTTDLTNGCLQKSERILSQTGYSME